MAKTIQTLFQNGTLVTPKHRCNWCSIVITGTPIFMPPTWAPASPGEASTYCSEACAWHHHPEKFPEIIDCEVPNCSLHKHRVHDVLNEKWRIR